MKPWVTKKTMDYMGEEEKSFIEYVLKRLRKKDPPKKLIKKVYEILEEDSQEFVYQLWEWIILSIELSKIDSN